MKQCIKVGKLKGTKETKKEKVRDSKKVKCGELIIMDGKKEVTQ